MAKEIRKVEGLSPTEALLIITNIMLGKTKGAVIAVAEDTLILNMGQDEKKALKNFSKKDLVTVAAFEFIKEALDSNTPSAEVKRLVDIHMERQGVPKISEENP